MPEQGRGGARHRTVAGISGGSNGSPAPDRARRSARGWVAFGVKRGQPRIDRAGGEFRTPACLQLRPGRQLLLTPAGRQGGDLALGAAGARARIGEDLPRALGESLEQRLRQASDLPLPASGLAILQAEPLAQPFGEAALYAAPTPSWAAYNRSGSMVRCVRDLYRPAPAFAGAPATLMTTQCV